MNHKLNRILTKICPFYYIMDAYDEFGNKVDHLIAHSFIQKQIVLFIWINKYSRVVVI